MKIVMKDYFSNIKSFFFQKETLLFSLTLLLHGLVILFLNLDIIPLLNNISDPITYHNTASQITLLFKQNNYHFGDIYNSHWYPFFISLLYIVFGPSMIIGEISNSLLAAASSVIFYKLLLKLYPNINKKIFFWVTLIIMNGYASFVYNSSLLLKETWIIFLLLLGFYLSLLIIENFKWYKFFLFLINFILLFNLRFFIGYALISGFLFGWFINNKFKVNKKIIISLCMVFFISISISFLNSFNFNISNSNQGTKNLAIQQVIKPENIYSIRTGYFKGGNLTTNISVVEKKDDGTSVYSIKGIIKSFVNVVAGPFPWQLTLKNYIFIFPDIIIWYLLLFTLIIGFLRKEYKRLIIFYISFFVIMSCLALGVDNLGALLRYRMIAVFVLAILSPVGLNFLLTNKRNENIIYSN